MLGDFILSTWAHFTTSVFLGILPVAITALCTGILIAVVNLLGGRSDTKALFGYALFFGAVGAALGLMLGASREPAVKVFLPAVVTLLSGLLVYVFPKESKEGRMLLNAGQRGDTPEFVRSFVIVGIAALMISATMGSFWGGSIRSIKEADARAYAEWEAEYKTVELPLRLEMLKRELGLAKPEADGE